MRAAVFQWAQSQHGTRGAAGGSGPAALGQSPSTRRRPPTRVTEGRDTLQAEGQVGAQHKAAAVGALQHPAEGRPGVLRVSRWALAAGGISMASAPVGLPWCLGLHTFSAFWLRSSVVSVLISLISDISDTVRLRN